MRYSYFTHIANMRVTIVAMYVFVYTFEVWLLHYCVLL